MLIVLHRARPVQECADWVKSGCAGVMSVSGCTGVVVLSPDFVRDGDTMEELRMLLDRMRSPHDNIRLLPVLYHISAEQCADIAATSYSCETWAGKPAQDVLQSWAVSITELLKIRELRIDQVQRSSHCLSDCWSSRTTSAVFRHCGWAKLPLQWKLR